MPLRIDQRQNKQLKILPYPLQDIYSPMNNEERKNKTFKSSIQKSKPNNNNNT